MVLNIKGQMCLHFKMFLCYFKIFQRIHPSVQLILFFFCLFFEGEKGNIGPAGPPGNPGYSGKTGADGKMGTPGDPGPVVSHLVLLCII